MSANSTNTPKELLGYRLRERIGAGGYGEVWSAEAPGGMVKAVKLIYGFHDEKRAQTELKALDRIKAVRHPFLLSLERIEVHEGQLVVVTELADFSLADVFDNYVAKGEPGVPRDELLRYIRDAAEGLDYLSQTHSLQHLDIKPENLLIVSGHVKVADFGLVKDLQHDQSQSLMSGMTPAYAAPELFDGQPGHFSDQYSLAIVYQEMLTGKRPFPGTTPAQLAAQHMHGKPNLRRLPKGDQTVIAKALSKDPQVRYPNCRAMVEELINRKINQRRIKRAGSIAPGEKRESEKTISVDSLQRDVTQVVSQAQLPFQANEMKTLAPPDIDAASAGFRPTLILTVGETASRAGQKIKQKLINRYHAMDNLPAIQLRCFDSDRSALARMTMEVGSQALTDSEAVALPLQSSSEYRARENSRFDWLSRRWIYNIPRSQQTEGLRPLGRLAFADHFDKVCTSLQQAIEEIVREENIARTADTLDLAPESDLTPRVFIVSSISGGIGSGMTLDLAYTVKLLLEEKSQKTSSVSGILLHSTNHRSREAGLSAANAFSFLTELRHYNDFGFPGDIGLGLPELTDEPPLDYVYFLDLGIDLKQTELEQELDRVAEYVHLGSASRCSVFFDECRRISDENEEHFNLRTFGLDISGPGSGACGENTVARMARSLISKWLKGSPDSWANDSEVINVWFREMDLHFDGISNRFASRFDRLISRDKVASITAAAKDIVLKEGPATRLHSLQTYFERQLGFPDAGHEVSTFARPEKKLLPDRELMSEAVEIAEAIIREVMTMLDGARLDVARPLAMLQDCAEKLTGIESEFDNAVRSSEQQFQMAVMNTGQIPVHQLDSNPDVLAGFQQSLQTIVQLQLQQFVLRSAKLYCRAVRKPLNQTIEEINHQCNEVKMMSSNSFPHEDDYQESNREDSIEHILIDSVHDRRVEMLERVEQEVYIKFVKTYGGFRRVLADKNCINKHLPHVIDEAVKQVLTDEYRRISFDDVIARSNLVPDVLFKWLNERLNSARPAVSQCGGGNRLLVATPAKAKKSCLGTLIENQFSVKPRMVQGTCGDIVMCFEGQQIPLASVAFRLLEERPDAVQLTRRIHTRSDVDWSTLDDLL
ncbi:MAG: tubulin-like doman-containing protein [Planctomycetota bacterium]